MDIPRSEAQYCRSARHDMAYIFKKFDEFLKAHPDSSDIEQLLERRRLRREWLDLGPVAQEAFAKGRQIDLIDREP